MMLKNITLSAEKEMIERARKRAEAHSTTLNSEFRRWLAQYVESPQTTADFIDLMDRFSYAKSERTFTRDEMNER
jgi:hypothetical protein